MGLQSKQLFFQAASEQDTRTLGAALANAQCQGAVIYLYGSLGAGKTTYVRGFLRELGFTGKVKSPTYTIVESYEMENFAAYHFDFYRVNHPQELQQLGLEDYFHDTAICLIEWPEKGKPLLPAPDVACYFDILESIRHIRLEACSNRGEDILARL